MGRAKLISTVKANLTVSASDNFIFYKVPISNVGIFHSAEIGNDFIVIKFYPRVDTSIFQIENKEIMVSFT